MDELYTKVNFLTVKEISDLWEIELKIPSSIISRELRIALYKLSIEYPFSKNIDIKPSEVDLPSENEYISRELIDRFCDKQIWKLPSFWFKGLPTAGSFPGRPSVMDAILQELSNRAERGELADSLAEQSRQLSEWAGRRFPGQQTPKPKSTENGIRSTYNMLKNQIG